MFGAGRATLYRQLGAQHNDRDCVLVVYRNTRPGKVDTDTNRRYGAIAGMPVSPTTSRTVTSAGALVGADIPPG